MQSDSQPTPRDTGAVSDLIDEVANSVDGYARPGDLARLGRIEKTPLCVMNPKDTFLFLSSKIPALQAFELVWTFQGAQLFSIGPDAFIRQLQNEYLNFPFSVGVEVYKLVQQKII